MNVRRLIPNSKVSMKGMLSFIEKKGYYVVITLCLAIVLVTVIYVTTYNVESNREYDIKNNIPDEILDNTVAQSSTVIPMPTVDAIVVAQDNAIKKNESNSTAAASTAVNASAPVTPTKFTTAPVFGKITFEYAQEKLVYSKTLEEWRTHGGVDIGADRGTAVKAVADGVVSEIKHDPRFGFTVVIDHQNGLKSLYANLAQNDTVSPNLRVKQGDIIGNIGNTAIFESIETPHLHFELLKNGTRINPTSYLPENLVN